jgi:hypothetical protein
MLVLLDLAAAVLQQGQVATAAVAAVEVGPKFCRLGDLVLEVVLASAGLVLLSAAAARQVLLVV